MILLIVYNIIWKEAADKRCVYAHSQKPQFADMDKPPLK